MYQFEDRIEALFAQCTPFDESIIRKSPEYEEISRTLQATRRLLERHAPDSMSDIDAFMDAYLELIDLECRHYFIEGYCIGRANMISSGIIQCPPWTDCPAAQD